MPTDDSRAGYRSGGRWLGAIAVALAVLSGELPGSGGVAFAEPTKPSTGQRHRVFFSGHSLLDNPLPDWVELIAIGEGDTLGWQEQIVLGSPIRVRTKGMDMEGSKFSGYQLGKSKSAGKIDVLAELKNPTQLAPGEKYDRLVITERNDLLGSIQWEDTIGYLRHFHDRLVAENPQATSFLFQCWPDIDRKEVAAWLAYVEKELFVWECVAARVNQSLASEGRADRVQVIPGGLALGELVKRALAGSVPGVEGTPEQRIDAIFGDEVHANPLGVYLLAAVNYAALYGKTPVGAPGPAKVATAALPLLQQIAWDTVSGYRARAARPPALSECRTRLEQDLCPDYQRLRGKPEKIMHCKSWTEVDSPFADVSPKGASEPVRSPLRAYVSWGSGAFALLASAVGYLLARRRGAM